MGKEGHDGAAFGIVLDVQSEGIRRRVKEPLLFKERQFVFDESPGQVDRTLPGGYIHGVIYYELRKKQAETIGRFTQDEAVLVRAPSVDDEDFRVRGALGTQDKVLFCIAVVVEYEGRLVVIVPQDRPGNGPAFEIKNGNCFVRYCDNLRREQRSMSGRRGQISQGASSAFFL